MSKIFVVVHYEVVYGIDDYVTQGNNIKAFTNKEDADKFRDEFEACHRNLYCFDSVEVQEMDLA